MAPPLFVKKYFGECLAGYSSLCAMTLIWFVGCEAVKFKECYYAKICLIVLMSVIGLSMIVGLIWLARTYFKEKRTHFLNRFIDKLQDLDNRVEVRPGQSRMELTLELHREEDNE